VYSSFLLLSNEFILLAKKTKKQKKEEKESLGNPRKEARQISCTSQFLLKLTTSNN
jgi:hypothetical protein